MTASPLASDQHSSESLPTLAPPSDLEIARAALARPINEVAEDLNLGPSEWEPYGRDIAKIDLSVRNKPRIGGRPFHVVVTAVTPTPFGEGKTTTAVGLAQAFAASGLRSVLTLRQPSQGPTFGVKGGAAGGGFSQVIPMERLNLHLTGDIHAVTAAHNLLAAMVDNRLHHEDLGAEARDVVWRRVLDVDDRTLRDITIGLGARGNGVPRQTGFDISAASEVMTLLGLSSSQEDLRQRLGRLVVAWTKDGQPITAEDIKAAGAMAILLRDALRPNLLQTLEGSPVLVHGGPFGNIANGANSIMADLIADRTAEVVVTEAGFGADLGFERFCNVKCRASGLSPDAGVVVVTVRAMKAHSGRFKIRSGHALPPEMLENSVTDVLAGAQNLKAHIAIVQAHGVTPVVAVNRFPTDHEDEIAAIISVAKEAGVRAAVTNHVAQGSAGAAELAEVTLAAANEPSEFTYLYGLDDGPKAQLDAIARTVYGADGVDWSLSALRDLATFEKAGYTGLPLLVAKTHLSLSHDPTLLGRPSGWRLPVRELRLAAGAGYLYAICGAIRLMPGLPKHPGAERMDLDAAGNTVGLS